MKVLVSALIAAFSVFALSGSALAWHPEGEITKTVSQKQVETNQVINYTITLKNTAKPAQKQFNDLAFITITDKLPEGIELVSDPSQRTITEKVDLLEPGKSFTREYEVKVTSQTDGAKITNTACFTADSVVKDNPKQGCGGASITVSVPEPEPAPVEPEEGKGGGSTDPEPQEEVKEDTVQEEAPAELPKTGLASFVPLIVGVSTLGYSANIIRLKRK